MKIVQFESEKNKQGQPTQVYSLPRIYIVSFGVYLIPSHTLVQFILGNFDQISKCLVGN